MIALAVLVIGALALVAYCAFPAWRQHRVPRDLRGDWWPRFEAEFRAYAERAATQSRRRGRHRRQPPR